MQYDSTDGAVFRLGYHVIWCPKYRRRVLVNGVDNRLILDKGWGIFAQRLEDKTKGRVEYVPAAYTSQRCSECGHVARENRENQAVFTCAACGHSDNADVNAAKNIAAGHAVTARGDLGTTRSVKREPQLLTPTG